MPQNARALFEITRGGIKSSACSTTSSTPSRCAQGTDKRFVAIGFGAAQADDSDARR